MKKPLLILFFVITVVHAFSQKKFELTGQIKDSSNSSCMEFCSVSVLNNKDSIIEGTVTNAKGFYTLNLSQGQYALKVSFIGYKTLITEKFHLNDNKFFGI